MECHLATKRRALRVYVTKSMVTLLLQKKETWRVRLCKTSKEDKSTKMGKGCGCLRLEVGIIVMIKRDLFTF